jgi:RNA polymerase sigma-70 factor (ECF subfamily)
LDQKEFISVVQDNRGIIQKVVYLYSNDSTTDRKDLEQEILLQLWKSLPGFQGKSAISTFMYKVCLNTAINFIKRKKRNTTYDLNNHLDKETITQSQEEYEILYLCIKKLPKSERAIINLHLDGYKNDEIAEIIGISKNHISVKIHRIKLSLTKMFTSYE